MELSLELLGIVKVQIGSLRLKQDERQLITFLCPVSYSSDIRRAFSCSSRTRTSSIFSK